MLSSSGSLVVTVTLNAKYTTLTANMLPFDIPKNTVQTKVIYVRCEELAMVLLVFGVLMAVSDAVLLGK
jgi:hypothetical protein